MSDAIASFMTIAVTIPAGTAFQFRCDGDDPLTAVGFTLPPWPGSDAVCPVAGIWEPSGAAVT